MKTNIINFFKQAKNAFLYSSFEKYLAVSAFASMAILVLALFVSKSALVALLLLLLLNIALLDIRMRIRTQEAHDSHFFKLYTQQDKKLEEVKKQLTNSNKKVDTSEFEDKLQQYIKDSEEKAKQTITKATRDQSRNLYVQIESLLNIHERLDMKKPLPSMSGWAITPDFGLLIIDTVEKNNYKKIVDLGSGVSTLIAGYIVQQLGGGRIVSVEHDEEFLKKTRQQVKEHGLEDVVDLRLAPLHEQEVDGTTYSWYDKEVIKDLEGIDLLLVDGPPGPTQKNARYPAVPLLYDRLVRGATIILDDYSREDERQAVNTWLERFPDLAFEEVRSEKGIALLRKPG